MRLFDRHGNMRGWAESGNSEESNDRCVELIACGDTGPVRKLEALVLNEGPEYVIHDMADELRAGDLVFANLEVPFSRKGKPINKVPTFRLDPDSFTIIKRAGINVASLANNHIFDFGLKAFDDTIELLTESGIHYFGAGRSLEQATSASIVTVKGIRFAFIGFMEADHVNFLRKAGPGVVPPMDFDLICDGIRNLRDTVDWIIVSLHFGSEYTLYPAPKDVKFCRKLIDQGADIIFGHHPHYPHGIERYNNGLIAYSLGNFIWDQKFYGHTASSFILKMTIAKREIRQVRLIPFRMNSEYQLEKLIGDGALAEIDHISLVLKDDKGLREKWYFICRNSLYNMMRLLGGTLSATGKKEGRFRNLFRLITSPRMAHIIKYFLIELLKLNAFRYEIERYTQK